MSGGEPMKRPMDAAGAVDAENAPTAPWKTRGRVFHKRPQATLTERGHFYFAKKGTFLFRVDTHFAPAATGGADLLH